MYLARKFKQNHVTYIIRESFYDGGVLTNRDLLELGDDPEVFITYSGKNYYLADTLVDQLEALGLSPDPFDLELLFFPFIDPYVRDRISPYIDRQKSRLYKPVSRELRQRILEQTHIFDRRRLHFLRFGQTNQVSLDRSTSLYRVLLDKSRDEIEQLCVAREDELSVMEYPNYMYTVFDLQRFFSESFARTMPEALNQEKLDSWFLEEICRLDQDSVFWTGFQRDDNLSSYLKRYVIFYFDYHFPVANPWREYIRNFTDSHRRYTPPANAQKMSQKEAGTIFGVSQKDISAMTVKQLTSLYRKKAHELHPDKEGGDHDKFIELTNAYNELLQRF